MARVSGSLLNPISLHIQMPGVKYKDLAQAERSDETSVIRDHILALRCIQDSAFQKPSISVRANRALEPQQRVFV